MARPPEGRAPSRPTRSLRALARRALAEDRYHADRTTRTLFPRAIASEARVTAQATGILSGARIARAVAEAAGVRVVRSVSDGRRVRPGTVVLRLRGDARRILGIERTLLNFLMHLSGIASLTQRAVEGAGGRIAIYATRKTLPGLRDLEKQAVADGGAHPHRRDLSEAVLIKNNHLTLVGLEEAVARARSRAGRPRWVEIEVGSVGDAVRAARAGADALLLDNLSPAEARRAVRALRRAGLRDRVWVELSGGVRPADVPRYARTGADAVSLGALTHSAPALPFHLRLRPLGRRRRAA